MPRIARIVIKDMPHHVTQHGNYNQKIFFSAKDKFHYLKLIKKYSATYKLDILAYCLMDNHVHFIVVPERADSTAKTFKMVAMQYAQYINKKKKMAGHLWRSRFFSCALDERHAYIAAKYIEQNPVKAKLVSEAWDWQWSSANYHIGGKDTIGFIKKASFIPPANEWKNELRAEEIKTIIDKLKWCTKAGRPYVDFDKLKKIEFATGKSLRYRRVGRPRK